MKLHKGDSVKMAEDVCVLHAGEWYTVKEVGPDERASFWLREPGSFFGTLALTDAQILQVKGA